MYHEFPILLNIGGKLYDHILIAVEPYLLGNGKHHHKHDILELSEIREFTCLSYTMRFVQFSLGIRVGETVDHHCFNLFISIMKMTLKYYQYFMQTCFIKKNWN